MSEKKNMNESQKSALHTENTEIQGGPAFQPVRIYTKDLSFEVPHAPEIFTMEGEPSSGFSIASHSVALDNVLHEVVLKVSVTTKLADKVVFICEVQQAGIFALQSFEPEMKKQYLEIFCPNLLLPFVREIIASLCVRGTFPPFNLVFHADPESSGLPPEVPPE